MQQHEVDSAADALLAERLRPTVERVRAKMGRGSPNTVAPMLENWFSGLAPRLGVVSTDEGEPAGPPAAVRQGMDQLWDVALRAAHETAATALSADRQALARERDELTALRRDVDGQLAAASQRESLLCEALQASRAQVEERAGELRETRTMLQQREGELERARASIADLVSQKDAAAREHARQVQAHGEERTRLSERAAATERRLLEEIDRAHQYAKAAHKKVAELQARLEAQHSETAQLRESFGAQVQALQLERAQLLERLAMSERLQEQVRTASARKPAATKKASGRARPARSLASKLR